MEDNKQESDIQLPADINILKNCSSIEEFDFLTFCHSFQTIIEELRAKRQLVVENEQHLKSCLSEILQLKEEAEDYKENVNRLQSEVKTCSAVELSKFKERIHQLVSEKTQSEKNFAQNEKELKILREMVCKLKMEKYEQEMCVKSLEQEIIVHKNRTGIIFTKLSEQKQVNNDIGGKLKSFEEFFNKLNAAVKNAELVNRKANVMNQHHLHQLNSYETQIRDLKEELVRVTQEEKSCEVKENIDLSKEKRVGQYYRQLYEESTANNEQLKKELITLEEKNLSSLETIRQYAVTLERESGQLSSYRSLTDDLENKLTCLRSEERVLLQKVCNAEHQLEKFRNEVAEVESIARAKIEDHSNRLESEIKLKCELEDELLHNKLEAKRTHEAHAQLLHEMETLKKSPDTKKVVVDVETSTDPVETKEIDVQFDLCSSSEIGIQFPEKFEVTNSNENLVSSSQENDTKLKNTIGKPSAFIGKRSLSLEELEKENRKFLMNLKKVRFNDDLNTVLKCDDISGETEIM